jgi:hypothetical protein
MMAVAASKAAAKPSRQSEEIRKKTALRPSGIFDLRQSLNYLKVKITGRNPTGAILAPSGCQASMMAS